MRHVHAALIVFITILYASNSYLYFWEQIGIKPLYWHAFTIFAAFLLVITTRFTLLKNVSGLLYLWGGVYLGFSIINYLLSSQSDVAEQILIYNVEAIALMISFWLILQQNGSLYLARLALIGVVVFGVCMNIVDFSTSPLSSGGRAAGLYINANISGKVLVLAMLACLPLVSNRLRILFCLFVGLGVLLTFSRSSWLLWAFVLVGLAVGGYLSERGKAASIGIVFFGVVFIVYSLLTGAAIQLFEQLGLAQYLTSNTIARLGGQGAAFTDSSTASRVEAAMMAWETFASHPWLGAGIGFTREWNYNVMPHNMFLIIAAESGLIGLAIFIWFLAILWWEADPLGRVMVAGFAFFSLFAHTMLVQPVVLILLPFFVTELAKQHSKVTAEEGGVTFNNLSAVK